MSKHTEQWASRLGVILAVAGSAVGLGNFLRFPGQAAANGGGAFMIPYFLALLLLGIPIGWAEWAMGRYGGLKGFHSAPAILGVIGGRVARYLGIIGVLIPLCVYFYYVFIESWCLAYAIKFFTGGIGVDLTKSVAEQVDSSRAFYDQLTGLARDGAVFDGGVVWFWAVTVVLNTYFVARGLSRGIETFCKWAMPAMAVLAVIVLIRVLTLGTPDPTNPEQNVINGLGKMWNPSQSALLIPQTWIAASGQIFFSLSVGFGVIINYASYMRRRDDVVLSGLTASSTNELFEVGFGGLITIPAAFVFLGASGIAGGTFGMGFNTLPVVFARMPMGNLIGGLWFFMLFLAAITSSLSMLQPAKAFFQEALGISPGQATKIVTGISLVGCAIVMWFSHGPVNQGGLGVALSTIDHWVGTFLITVLAAVQVICFAWVFGVDRGLYEAMRGARIRIPWVFRYVYLFVAPAYLLFTIGWACIGTLPSWTRALFADPAAMVAMGLILVVTGLLVYCTAIGEKRWRSMGLDLDGRDPLPEEPEAMRR